jgi:transcription termination factor NusB
MKKLIKLFNPTYAIYCLQGSSWGSATLGTKKEIVELYKWYAEQQDIEEHYFNQLFAKPYTKKTLDYIADWFELVIFKNNKALEDMSYEELDNVERNIIYGR